VERQSHTQSVKLRNTRGNTQRPRSDVANQAQGNYQRDFYDDEEYDDVWPSRMPTSARRYQSDARSEAGRTSADVQALSQGDYRTSNPGRTGSTIPPRRTATQVNLPAVQPARRRPLDTEEAEPRRSGYLVPQEVAPRRSGRLIAQESGQRVHWLVFVGLAMIVMMVGWMLLTTFMSWWQVAQDDLHYGRPRTSQYDQVVGHNDSVTNRSHFIALNLNRHVEIIECPAGDCAKARVLMGPVLIGQGQDLAPVTLSFKDVNGDDKLDIVVNVQDSRFVFINDNGTFRPTRAGDNIHL